MSEDKPSASIGLAEFIEALRAEIAQAANEGADKAIRFKAGSIDLELQLKVEKKGGANGKIEFRVFGTGVSLGGDASATRATTHTLKMRLEPDWDGKIGAPRPDRPD
jgi:hypothetical protein